MDKRGCQIPHRCLLYQSHSAFSRNVTFQCAANHASCSLTLFIASYQRIMMDCATPPKIPWIFGWQYLINISTPATQTSLSFLPAQSVFVAPLQAPGVADMVQWFQCWGRNPSLTDGGLPQTCLNKAIQKLCQKKTQGISLTVEQYVGDKLIWHGWYM